MGARPPFYLLKVRRSVHQTLYHHRAWETSECLLMRNSLCALCTHIQRTVSRCFATLRQLRGIRSSVPQSVFQSLVTALVLSRLDYCNSALVGLPAHWSVVYSRCRMRQLGSFFRSATRSISRMRSWNSTGSEFPNGSSTSWLFRRIEHWTAQLHATCCRS